jgi:hypothetical protein
MLTPIAEPPDSGPALLVVVDTEEEFDWSAPFAREHVDVTAIAELPSLQRALAPYRLVPTYVVDYPVAVTPSSAAVLAQLAADRACHVGAHLHPWVTPPFDEPLTPAMSFGCNLEPALERVKVGLLTEAIERHLHVNPTVYKAGRYGFGQTTANTLEALGFDIDVSVIPHMDFSDQGGPAFCGVGSWPATFGQARRLLELPCTTGFIGAARHAGETLHRAASRFPRLRGVGLLSRTGVLNRVMLSPEGNTLAEMRALTQALYDDGLRTFALTLHSTSLKAGCTPYVRTKEDRALLLDTIDRYCDFFFRTLEGTPTTAEERYLTLVASPSPAGVVKRRSSAVDIVNL